MNNKENESSQYNNMRRGYIILIIFILVVVISMITGYELGKMVENYEENANKNDDEKNIIVANSNASEENSNITEDYNNSTITISTDTNTNTSTASTVSTDTNSATSSSDLESIDEEPTNFAIQLDELDLQGNVVQVAAKVLQLYNYSSMYVVNGKIAPESAGAYNFYVTNNNNFDVKYQVKFAETNESDINMRYKIKINDEYVQDTWVKLDEIEQEYKNLEAETQIKYTIEWKWISSSNDTEIGITPDSYKLSIEINATS